MLPRTHAQSETPGTMADGLIRRTYIGRATAELATESGESEDTPERALAKAMILQALQDILAPRPVRFKSEAECRTRLADWGVNRLDAFAWVFGLDEEQHTFEDCCALVGLLPDYVRTRMRVQHEAVYQDCWSQWCAEHPTHLC